MILDPFVYKHELKQGNIIEQIQVSQLKKNMTYEQTEFLLGSPLLIDLENKDMWYYISTKKNAKDKEEQKSLTLIFKNNLLEQAFGDFDLPRDLQSKEE